MNLKASKFLKAAFLSAAFLFSEQSVAGRAEFNEIKLKSGMLLVQKKKLAALRALTAYIKAEGDIKIKAEATQFMAGLAQKFILREAQEAYESSINQTLENPKESYKSNELCLSLEPEQLQCLIQKMRLQVRNKDEKDAIKTIKIIKELVPGSRVLTWLELTLIKNKEEFKNKSYIKILQEKPSDEDLALVFIELDRSFFVRNYSRAKEILQYIEKHHLDWPDLVYYKNKLNLDSSEDTKSNNIKPDVEPLMIYKNKCKAISKTIARKFRYDFDLCSRGN